ncbi:MAG: hypothetical protein AUG49_19385 [Catenulispora sp. 13_1_20CM_3_70_7]|nr:MAG: hypothetical protein AUG49_19385 [Catenulispora sp. 13_1_20CM_3_70_7]
MGRVGTMIAAPGRRAAQDTPPAAGRSPRSGGSACECGGRAEQWSRGEQQLVQTLLDPGQVGSDGEDVAVISARLALLELDQHAAARRQDHLAHVPQVPGPLPARGGDHVGRPQRQPAQGPALDLAVADQDAGCALQPALELRRAIGQIDLHADEQRVHEDQHRRSVDPAGQRVVVADDRVLHDVRQQQHHRQIQGVELRQLPFPGQPQQEHDGGVDQDRAQGLLAVGDSGLEHVMPHAPIVWIPGRPDEQAPLRRTGGGRHAG